MASINLGRVGFVLRGNYAATEEYNPLDVVYYTTTGMCYAAKVHIPANSSGLLPTVETAWLCLVDINQVIDTSTMVLINASAVRFDAAQNLTDAQKLQARQNIGVGTGLVSYDTAQTLTEQQKTQARENISAAALSSLADVFSSSNNYESGEYVIRYGTLFKFTQDHPAGSWTGSDVALAIIGNELGYVKDDINTLRNSSVSVTPTDASGNSDGMMIVY